VAEPRRSEVAAHLAACAECQETHDFLAIQGGDFPEIADADTWEPLVGTPTFDSLMSYGARVAEEDRDAEEILEEFLESPITAAWSTLLQKRRNRTGGVVRKLNAAAHAICESRPLVALTFADAASAVAESLPEDLYPARAVHQLRGTAWKERANALMLLGQFREAHQSLDRAQRAYGKTPHNALGLSIVALVRAGVYYEQGLLDEAMQLAERAEVGFAHADDTKRRMDAVFLRGIITFEAGSPNGALPLFLQLIEQGENAGDRRLIALGSYTAALCELDRGNLSEASMLFHRALVIFREEGPERERLLTEWGIARLVLQGGAPALAARRLRDVAAAFEEHGMATKTALVGLDLADALLALERPQEIVTLAQHLFTVFTNAGMLTGALTAIAYLKEAAANGSLTTDALRELRTFLKKAERHPTLRFVPPPGPS
jgi:tetratricopeptide (TPR) repeat protein